MYSRHSKASRGKLLRSFAGCFANSALTSFVTSSSRCRALVNLGVSWHWDSSSVPIKMLSLLRHREEALILSNSWRYRSAVHVSYVARPRGSRSHLRATAISACWFTCVNASKRPRSTLYLQSRLSVHKTRGCLHELTPDDSKFIRHWCRMTDATCGTFRTIRWIIISPGRDVPMFNCAPHIMWRQLEEIFIPPCVLIAALSAYQCKMTRMHDGSLKVFGFIDRFSSTPLHL